MMELKLTPAQHGALQCRAGGGLDPLLERCWRGGLLCFEAHEREALAEALCEASNAEDAQAELFRDKGARGAARALANLMLRVSRAT